MTTYRRDRNETNAYNLAHGVSDLYRAITQEEMNEETRKRIEAATRGVLRISSVKGANIDRAYEALTPLASKVGEDVANRLGKVGRKMLKNLDGLLAKKK